MFKTLSDKVQISNKLPQRAQKMEVLKQVLTGTIYDVQTYQFHEERDSQNKPVSISARAPAVDIGLGLIRTTVNHTISFVFGEGRFPEVDCEDENIRNHLSDLIDETNLAQVMQSAMFWGSLGSVGIHVKLSSTNRIHFKVYPSQYLTPVWDQDDPDVLVGMQEKYVTTGQELIDMGYDWIDPATALHQYFFMRRWDKDEETWYVPWPVVQVGEPVPPRVDLDKTVQHNLGFVPWVWIKNLRGGDDIDGVSTFAPGIKACIELDYLVSQGDRGLKYQADPTLVIVDPNADRNSPMFRSAAQALILGKDGKAEILEMKGTAHNALLEQVKALREAALEAMGGNRSSPDKLQAAQSGAALELLWQPVVMLAGDLRNSYGENGLLTLLEMVLKIGSSKPLSIAGEFIPLLNANERIWLTWPEYFEPTLPDRQAQATTLLSLVTGGLMSKDAAVRIISGTYDIEDVDQELQQIETEASAQMDQRVEEAKQLAVVTAKEPASK